MVDLAISLVEGLILLVAELIFALQILNRAFAAALDGLGEGLGRAVTEALTWLAVVGAIVVAALLALVLIVRSMRSPRAAT